MLDRLGIVLSETCDQMDCALLEFGGEDDHVHLMVSVHPKLAVANLVGKLQGKSSYILRKEYWHKSKTSFGENTFGHQVTVWSRAVAQAWTWSKST